MKIRTPFQYTFALLFLVLLASSCREPCKDVQCFNGGECVDGFCICEEGFYGQDCGLEGEVCGSGFCVNGGTCVNNACSCPPCYKGQYCEFPDLEHYIGIYNNQELCDAGSFTYQVAIDSTQLAGYDLVIYNLAGANDFAGMNLEGCNFSIPLQNYSTGTISGSGSITFNGESVNMAYSVSFNGVPDNCTSTLSKI